VSQHGALLAVVFTPGAQIEQDEFAAASNAKEPGADEGALEVPGLMRSNNAGASDADPEDLAAGQYAGEVADEDLDFGELGHGAEI
jgi:hypothetical protein